MENSRTEQNAERLRLAEEKLRMDDNGLRRKWGAVSERAPVGHGAGGYFHGDTGRGVGASHQTGWTALAANLLKPDQGGLML